MESINRFGDAAMSSIHKFLVYFGSTLLIASLFFDVKDFSLGVLRQAAYRTVFYGMLLWTISLFFSWLGEYFDGRVQMGRFHTESDLECVIKRFWFWKFVSYFAVLILGFFHIILVL